MEILLQGLLPRVLLVDCVFDCRVFQGKQCLMRNLADRLGFAAAEIAHDDKVAATERRNLLRSTLAWTAPSKTQEASIRSYC